MSSKRIKNDWRKACMSLKTIKRKRPIIIETDNGESKEVIGTVLISRRRGKASTSLRMYVRQRLREATDIAEVARLERWAAIKGIKRAA